MMSMITFGTGGEARMGRRPAFTEGLLARCFAALALVVLALAAWPASSVAQTVTPAASWATGLSGLGSLETSGSDGDGNVYFAGQFSSASITVDTTTVTRIGTGTNVMVGKVSSSGTVQWAKAVGGTSNPAMSIYGMAVDPSGNSYFLATFNTAAVDFGGTGNVALNGATTNTILGKFRADGTIAWGVSLASTATTNAVVQGYGIALDSSYNPVVVGRFNTAGATIGGTAMTLTGAQNVFVAKFDAATGAAVWGTNFGGTLTNSDRHQVGLDGANNVYISGTFTGGAAATLVIGSTTLTTIGSTGANNIYLARLGTTGTPVWAKNFGGTAGMIFSGGTPLNGLSVDSSGNSYLVTSFAGANLNVGSGALTWKGATSSNTDILVAKFDSSGNTAWAKNFGTVGAASSGMGMRLDSSGNVYISGSTAASTLTLGDTVLTRKGSTDAIAARLANDTGAVTWALNFGSTGSSTNALPIAVSGSSTLVIAGGYGTAAFTFGSTVLPAGSSKYYLAAITQTSSTPTPTPTPVTPPAPPPAFVSGTNPPPSVINANTTGSGQGTISLSSSFTNPSSLTFTASQTSGAALPSWLIFNPSTVSFSYDVPLPANLPIQPSADASADATARAVKAGRSVVNTVYPLAVLVQTVPVSLTATGGGQTYAVTVNMDFYAPRSPVAITAVSYAAGGTSGNAASARPSLSWDGGQLVFETAATNITAVSNNSSSIVRYHGLSGQRDLLSQTAIPGGGVANGADGNSNNPAVSAAGNYAAFSSAAPSVSATPNNRLRQVYRTSLVYPRVAVNEQATPASIMISTTAAGVAADAAADLPSMSEQGTFIAFESAAGNLGANPDRLSQIWRKDVTTGAIVLVSSTAAGVAGNGDSRNVSLSWDGNFAVFDSTATNLAAGASGRHVYLKNLVGGQVYRLSQQAGASNARMDARLASVVYTSVAGAKSQVLRYDIATGVTSVVSVTPSGVAGNGDSTQASMSADGRFVAFRSTSTDLMTGYADNGQAQIWVRDVLRGVTALVTQTEAGAPGNGASSDPAVSGDGGSIGFASQSTNLVNGTPLAGQIHLAGNPLVLPGRTAYWYTTDGGNLTWSVERWGDKALVAGLAYTANGGTAVWAAGSCQFTGLVCQGTVSQWSRSGASSTTVGPLTLTFAANGTQASYVLGSGAARSLALYPVGGTRTTGFAGLPQNGYWGVNGNAAGVSSLFIDTDTQAASDGSSSQVTHVTLFGYDASGNAQWYAAEGALASDQSFTGQLYLYSGGSTWSGTAGSNAPSATAVGMLRLNFTATDRATAQLPDGRTVAISRWRF